MNSRKVFNNAKWIVLCRVGQSLLQLLIGMFTARYLGPANYGLIGYVASVTAFVLPLMQLGLLSTLIQELIQTPEDEGKIMGTAMGMSLLSGLFSYVVVCLFVTVANPGETETLIVCALYSLSLLFRALELMQPWFHYKLASKYSSIVMLCSYIIVSCYKIFLLVTAKSIYWFALVNTLDYAIIGILLICLYQKIGGQKLAFSPAMIRRLLNRSKYYILAAVMGTVFQNTDHVMLKMMIDDIENGYYTAAVTSAVVCMFLYQAIVDSMRPVILESKKTDRAEYKNKISKLYCITIYMAIVQAIGFSFFARFIIRILYGEAYFAAVPVLKIYVWQLAFSNMGWIRNIWILAEGKDCWVWKINIVGAVLNVLLNTMFIPKWGASGAAAATLLTQFLMNFVLGFIIKDLQENNRLLMRGLDIRMIKEVLYDVFKIIGKRSASVG